MQDSFCSCKMKERNFTQGGTKNVCEAIHCRKERPKHGSRGMKSRPNGPISEMEDTVHDIFMLRYIRIKKQELPNKKHFPQYSSIDFLI